MNLFVVCPYILICGVCGINKLCNFPLKMMLWSSKWKYKFEQLKKKNNILLTKTFNSHFGGLTFKEWEINVRLSGRKFNGAIYSECLDSYSPMPSPWPVEIDVHFFKWDHNSCKSLGTNWRGGGPPPPTLPKCGFKYMPSMGRLLELW